jgi:hypothetical protein
MRSWIALVVVGVCGVALARSEPVGPEHAGYKAWQATTAEPYTMLDAADCRAGNQPLGPHGARYIRVFVNGPGREAIGTVKPYATGTVIVKEKLLKKDDAKPSELGIMIKRETGWEYKFIGADGKLAVGNAEGNNVMNCATCHARAKHDSVFITAVQRK